jgi:hypothetical protein
MGEFLARFIAEANLGTPHIVVPDVGTAATLSVRAVGEDPREQGTGGEGIPGQPWDPRGGRTGPWPPGALAEVVFPLRSVRARKRWPGRLDAGPQETADQQVLAASTARAGRPGPADEPESEVELVEVGARGQAWWSLGFEATGPASLLRAELEAAAALVFAQVLPGEAELGTDGSSSYEE